MLFNHPNNERKKISAAGRMPEGRGAAAEFNIDIDGIFLQQEQVSKGHDAIRDLGSFDGPTTPFPHLYDLT